MVLILSAWPWPFDVPTTMPFFRAMWLLDRLERCYRRMLYSDETAMVSVKKTVKSCEVQGEEPNLMTGQQGFSKKAIRGNLW